MAVSMVIQLFSKFPDDHMGLYSQIMTCGMSAMIYMQIQTGMGRHIEYSQAHPGMLKDSMKVRYRIRPIESLLSFAHI